MKLFDKSFDKNDWQNSFTYINEKLTKFNPTWRNYKFLPFQILETLIKLVFSDSISIYYFTNFVKLHLTVKP